jgi:major membrane immunogen (membrane-anchored lipoprotein)
MKLIMQKKYLAFIFVFVTLISACGKTSNSENMNSNPTPSSKNYSNSEKALALARAGCSEGYIDSITDEQEEEFLSFELWKGNVTKELFKYKNIDIYDLNNLSNEESSKRFFYQRVIWQTEYTEQALISAKTLDTKWSELYDLYVQGANYAISEFNNGATVGQSIDAAFDKYSVRMNAICKISHLEIKEITQSSNVTVKQWITEVAGSLLPKDFELQENL